ncbi:MAG TPA: HdeD family acid-resistance protein [Phycisphaerae bacterium]|nr:HdeD family acid-resistance protein [Phycisphaerae bacterium]
MTIHPIHTGLERIKHDWGWFFGLGLALILLGVMSMIVPEVTTLFVILFCGWLLVFGGFFETFGALFSRHWNGFFLHLFFGILSIVIGGLIVFHPDVGALALTMLLAAFFLISGLFRIVTAVEIRLPGWGWSVVAGIITALLGILIWAKWPISSSWVIGLLVGIELFCRGWVWLMFALGIRRLAKTVA